MHRRVASSRPLHKGGRQVGPRGLHRNCVLVCDGIHRNEPQHEIHLLHR